jgi:hypothetical protein
MRYKKEVVNAWENRALPLQLNGASGIKRHSHNLLKSSIEISTDMV